MIGEALVAFARPSLETRAVDDAQNASASNDQLLRRQFLDHGVDGRSLDPEKIGEGFLGELDPVAGAVLRVEQPTRRSLGNRMEAVAHRRLHHLSE